MMNDGERQGAYQQEELTGRSSDGSLPLQEMGRSVVNRSCRQPTCQQADEGFVNGLANSMAVVGQTGEAAFSVQEMNQIPDQTAVRDDLQNLYQLNDDGSCISSNHCNGDEAMEVHVFYPLQDGNLVSDQRVERPEQSSNQQRDGALANGLRSPTQETTMPDTFQGPERLEFPVQEEGNQAFGCSSPVQETSAVRRAGECEDLPQCLQLLNDFHVNGVSSLGQTEQAVEHCCDNQELRLWEQKRVRQVSVTPDLYA